MVGKSNVMSTPQFGWPNISLLRCVVNGKCNFEPSHASPSSSGVTATGENALEGLEPKKPKPFASSPGIKLRKETSFTNIIKMMCFAASWASAPIGTSLVITATSDSKSIPNFSEATKISSLGPMKASEPPWYIRGSVQKVAGISAFLALRTNSTWLT